MEKSKMITKNEDSDYEIERKRMQKVNFAKIQEILQRNVSKNTNKTYLQYTKDLLKQYLTNVNSNQQTLREISRFVCRNSMLYQKILMYYASMPLFYYNITQINDLGKSINANKALKDYQTVLQNFEQFNLKKEGYNALYVALRDGIYVGYLYDSEEDGKFLMPLDSQYLKIYGKTSEGEWIVYMDASFFDAGSNKDFIYGVNEDGIGVWDDVFIEGYNGYKQDSNLRWFRLTPEKTFCLITGSDDEFYAPLPFLLPLLKSLLDLLDLEELLMSRTELENYILLISKIPLMDNTENVDDFALSLELVQQMQQLIDSVIPELIGTAYSPMDIEKIEFQRSNTSDDTDKLAQSVQNLFNNAGVSQLVVAGGSSSNSIGLGHALENDAATTWIWVERIQSWLNYYIKKNISEGYKLKIHPITWYNRKEYQDTMSSAATLGGSALDYLTSLGDSPYMAFQKLTFENAIGIKDLMIPLSTSYTQSNNSKGGRPQKGDDELSESGAETRSGEKNEGTKANK